MESDFTSQKMVILWRDCTLLIHVCLMVEDIDHFILRKGATKDISGKQSLGDTPTVSISILWLVLNAFRLKETAGFLQLNFFFPSIIKKASQTNKL